MLPEALRDEIYAALQVYGDSSPIQDERPVGGGCIHHALQLHTQSAAYFLKWNDNAVPGMFSTEASGLILIRQTQTLRVPEVITVSEKQENCPAFLLMEWVGGEKRSAGVIDQRILGEGLAEMHRRGNSPCSPAAYGLDEDNFLGRAAQHNGWDADWIDFFRQKRLSPQILTARRNGHIPPERQKRLEKLMEHLDQWLGGVDRRPCLVHGDLWHGNVMADQDGNPVLLDPAVYYADREVEIAYTHLFRGFGRHFYEAYQHSWPMEEGFAERRDLYNLYHLINHLNHFGEPYGSQVDEVLNYYIG
jgi:fructosamine-3-kinase